MTLRTLATLLALFSHVASAQAQTLTVLSAGALKDVAQMLAPAFESRTGIKVRVQDGTAGALVKRVEAGEAFDVVIGTRDGIDRLAAAGRVDPATRTTLADVGIGVGVKEGAPLPPLATVEQFKAAVLGARKIALIDPTAGGSSGIYLDRLFRELGMAEAVRAKAILVPGGLAGEHVASGEADLVLQQVSEILVVKGVVLAGMLPDAIQNLTTYAAGVSARSTSAEAAKAFVAALAGADAAELMRARRIRPVLLAAADEAAIRALEAQSWAAWKARDGAFFEQFLSDDHVEVHGFGLTGKAAVVEGVRSPACVVQSYSLGPLTLTAVTPDAVLVTYRAEQDTRCGNARVPSPVWATSLYVRRAGQWRNLLYQHTPVS